MNYLHVTGKSHGCPVTDNLNFGFRLNFFNGALSKRDKLKGEYFKRLKLEESGLHPKFRWLTHGDWKIGLLGHPIVGFSRNDESVLREFIRLGDITKFASSLNGSFLIFVYNCKTNSLKVISDRFSSFALYYAFDGFEFRAAMFLSDLIAMRRDAGLVINIDSAAIFEFIAMRRLFGVHTYEKNCLYLDSASILTLRVGEKQPEVTKYWTADYSTLAPRGRKLINAISKSLSNTLKLHLSDDPKQRYGLFLSGGLDARAVLAASVVQEARPPVSITTCLNKNNEFYVAEEVALKANAEHYFIPRQIDIYEGNLDSSVRMCSGMQSFVECQFLEYGSHLPVPIDTMLMGLILDIFFAGLYLPKKPVKFFGRDTLHYRLRPISDDFINEFINGVSYRMKTLDPFMLLRENKKNEMKFALKKSLNKIAQKGKALGASNYDLWEYMHHHNLSRHYSFPMMTSIRTWANCISPALENGIFDLAISMTAEQKVNATAYIYATSNLDSAIMKVRNANTNLPAWMPLPLQSIVKASLMLSNYLFGTGYPQSPSDEDRSWPLVSTSMSASKEITKVIHHLPDSIELDNLKIFDMSKVKYIVNEHEKNIADHGAALAVLVTVDRFLKLIENTKIQFKPDNIWEM